MSAEWTVERLDDLPEGTIIEWPLPKGTYQAVKEADHWWGLFTGDPVDVADILGESVARSIRVVSVPCPPVATTPLSSFPNLALGNAPAAPRRVDPRRNRP